MTDSACLTCKSAALNLCDYVELISSLCKLKRLTND